MPGVVGFSVGDSSGNSVSQTLAHMRSLINHDRSNRLDALFVDHQIAASCVHLGITETVAQPHTSGDVSVWLDGEIYDPEELLADGAAGPRSSADVLAALYRDDPTLRFLNLVDGFFAAAIYDRGRSLLHLITDRFGLRHLYVNIDGRSIAWSSELKAFLALPGFNATIDPIAVRQFFSIGYLLDRRTWFDRAELLPSGSVLTWDLQQRRQLALRRYWWWTDITPVSGRLDEREVAEELGRLFVQSVRRRCRRSPRHGVTLSGGLDSRAILAAIPEQSGDKLTAVTFGLEGSLDLQYAAQAAREKGARHVVLPLNSSNWLSNRTEAVWWTDGNLNLMHMHGVEHRERLRQLIDVNLNGFLGDVILGGSFLKERRCLDQPVSADMAARAIGCEAELLGDLSPYAGIPHPDVFLVHNRGRRFIAEGTRHFLTVNEQRKPFFDNQLIEFAYALPDTLRFGSRIYRLMLLKLFPNYFERIPWQKTGTPISSSRAVASLSRLRLRLASRLAQSLGTRSRKDFTDYSRWTQQEPARPFFARLLDDQHALYRDWTAPDLLDACKRRARSPQARAELLCRTATFEIWLQQIYNQRWRQSAAENSNASVAV